MEHGEQVGELPGFHKVERTLVIVKADESSKIRLMISEEMERTPIDDPENIWGNLG